MSSQLKEIKSPVAEELKVFSEYFNNSLKSKISLLDRILKYVVKRKGKQIRPLFVILSASLNGQVSEKTYRGASLIELLHTATLIHDDVVDESLQRRGSFSINALWKNKTSVLLGDYLLSRGMLLAVDNNDHDLLKITSDAVSLMSEGELLQIEKARKLNIREDVYFDIIRMKTASLISSSCGVGAASVLADKEKIELMKKFGEKAGIAFQIKDDLLDFSDLDTGKPKGGDLKEKKLTLPLIHALNKSPKPEKKKIINKISKSASDANTYKLVYEFIQKHEGFEYAKKMMTDYKNQALELLNTYPDSPVRQSLSQLVEFTINRKK